MELQIQNSKYFVNRFNQKIGIMKNLLTLSLLLLSFHLSILTGQEKQAGKIITDYYASLDAGNSAALANFYTDDISAIIPFSPVPLDKNSLIAMSAGFKMAFPDMHHEIVSWFADDDKVAVSGIVTGTNKGALMGNPPTQNKVKLHFAGLIELNGKGKIKSMNVQMDVKAFEAQLMSGINPNAITEKNIREMFKAADDGDIEKFAAYWNADGVHYFLGNKSSVTEFKARLSVYKSAFPDIKRNLDEIIISGNRVSVRGTVTGTNTGMFKGKPATNNKINVSWMGVYHLRADGKIESGWVEFDTATMDKQLANQ
jgi:steroid delta-isomerase-like uncharacterized protein